MAEAEETDQPALEISADKSSVFATVDTGDGFKTIHLEVEGGPVAQVESLHSGSFVGYVEVVPFGNSGEIAAALVTDSSVELAWSSRGQVISVIDQTDERYLNPIQNGNAVDSDVNRGRLNEYSLQVADPRTKSSSQESIDFLNIALAVPSSSTLSSTATSLNSTLAATLASTSTFRQNTFIPDAYVPAPAGACTDIFDSRPFRFVGDNRTWSTADAASSRTHMDLKVTWGTSTPPVTFTKVVGETVRQVQISNGTWNFESRLTASDTSMSATVLTRTSSFVSARLYQNVTNPMCNSLVTNGISSTTDINIYRSGVVSGNITYLQMPNYELYFRQDATAWRSLACCLT